MTFCKLKIIYILLRCNKLLLRKRFVGRILEHTPWRVAAGSRAKGFPWFSVVRVTAGQREGSIRAKRGPAAVTSSHALPVTSWYRRRRDRVTGMNNDRRGRRPSYRAWVYYHVPILPARFKCRVVVVVVRHRRRSAVRLCITCTKYMVISNNGILSPRAVADVVRWRAGPGPWTGPTV